MAQDMIHPAGPKPSPAQMTTKPRSVADMLAHAEAQQLARHEQVMAVIADLQARIDVLIGVGDE